MKNKLIILFGLVICFADCEREYYHPDMYPANETVIRGQLIYKANPFDTSDSVLCLTDVIWLDIKTKDTSYLAYLDTLLFGGIEGRSHRHKSGDLQSYEQIPDSFVFYIIKNDSYMSVMDEAKQSIADSLVVTFQYLYPPKEKTSTCVIILTQRPDDKQRHIDDVYLGDYVSYDEKDYGPQPLIFDSVTPEGRTIFCVDGTYGPAFGATWKWMNEE